MVGERDYSEMSPQELNSKFRRFCSLFPRFELVLPRESSSIERIMQLNPETREELLASLLAAGSIEAEERRSTGELKAQVLSGIERLLSRYSKTTEAFLPIIMDQLNREFEMGIVVSEPASETDDWPFGNLLPILLDEEDPESGGVFELSSAVSIERRSFRIIKRQREEVSNLIRELLQERIDEERNLLFQLGFFGSDEKDVMFQEWQAAIIVRDGDEP